MSTERVALLVTIGVPLLLRLIDWLLPPGHHFTWVDRYGHPDKPTPEEEGHD